ncbi:hypothetical protein [Hyphococcus sp.]|uniref:hypothetical protein n=1 Tax=Hyphococcus sp. TaxID=2038636 RepID=UPI0035C69C9C
MLKIAKSLKNAARCAASLTLAMASLVSGCASDKSSTSAETRLRTSQSYAEIAAETLYEASEEYRSGLELLVRERALADDGAADPHQMAAGERAAMIMARAALKRRTANNEDLPPEVQDEIARKSEMMLEGARRAAAGDAAVLAAIDSLVAEHEQRTADGKGQVFGNLLGKGVGTLLLQRNFDTLHLEAAETKTLPLEVTPAKRAIVYVESAAASKVSLTIRDAVAAELCRDASPHGFLICRWRPENNDPVEIIIKNAGDKAADILVVISQ